MFQEFCFQLRKLFFSLWILAPVSLVEAVGFGWEAVGKSCNETATCSLGDAVPGQDETVSLAEQTEQEAGLDVQVLPLPNELILEILEKALALPGVYMPVRQTRLQIGAE